MRHHGMYPQICPCCVPLSKELRQVGLFQSTSLQFYHPSFRRQRSQPLFWSKLSRDSEDIVMALASTPHLTPEGKITSCQSIPNHPFSPAPDYPCSSNFSVTAVNGTWLLIVTGISDSRFEFHG